jgi:hypothetical protein
MRPTQALQPKRVTKAMGEAVVLDGRVITMSFLHDRWLRPLRLLSAWLASAHARSAPVATFRGDRA